MNSFIVVYRSLKHKDRAKVVQWLRLHAHSCTMKSKLIAGRETEKTLLDFFVIGRRIYHDQYYRDRCWYHWQHCFL